MKKVVVALCLMLLGATLTVAAPANSGKKLIKNSKIVQGSANYEGVSIDVPAGQTVIVGKRDNGLIAVRGQNLENVKINGASVYTKGYTILSYNPQTHIAYLSKGEELTIIDRANRSATVEQGGAISTDDATINSNTKEEIKEAAQKDFEAAKEEGIIGGEEDPLPAFVRATATTQAAREQVAEDVEDTLSPSAPH